MRKKEFLRQLSKKLNNMSRHDREDILAYYDELIEDKLDRTNKDEEDIIDDLGSIDRIARKVSRIANESNTSSKIRVEDDYEEGYTKGNRKRKKTKKANWFMAFISTILAIILVPIFVVLGIVVGAVIISVFAASFAVVIGGIYVGGTGIVVAFSNFNLGLLQVGLGIAAIGVGIIIFPLISKVIMFAYKLLIKITKKIWRTIKYIGGSSYEN